MSVYFIQAGEGGPIKIGLADDPHSRCAALQTGCPAELTIITVRDGDLAHEAAAHRRFRSLRIRGEWFTPAAPLIEFIASGDPIDTLGWDAESAAAEQSENQIKMNVWKNREPEPFLPSFPALLAARKAALDLTWPALAERCGVHEQAVKGWASGEYLPSRSRLADVARGLECPLSEVVTATNAPDGVAP